MPFDSKAPIAPDMYGWARDLFPICRSLTGPGVRETLDYLAQLLPGLQVHAVASGTQVFDWTVPDEWTIRDAYIADDQGRRVVDFRAHNLHVVGYSVPVDQWLSREELDSHLYSLPDQPDAIPYVTSYYARRWGFCLTHRQRESLPPGQYRVVIDSDLKPGVLNYGELVIPGRERTEIFFSTYVCHPSMANNELSGPVVTAALAQWLMAQPDRRFTYRFVFIPETIGSITYLSRNLDHLKRHVHAGYVITCCGDDRAYSLLQSRLGDTIADRAARNVLRHATSDFDEYSFMMRGSDERQYCSPGVDLPMASVMRSKYDTYPEYHTSLDDLSFISQSGLEGALRVYQKICELLERNYVYRAKLPCEPQLGRRGLYSTLGSGTRSGTSIPLVFDVLAYADGEHDLIQMAERIGASALDCADMAEKLNDADLLTREDAG